MIINLHRGRGLVDALIRWQTRSPYSHASISLDSGELIEAVGEGVRMLEGLPAAQDVDRFEVATTPEQAHSIYIWLTRQLGKRYDYTMVLRFLTREQETRKSKGAWFCSELVFAAFAQAGIELLARTDPWEVSPGLLSKSPLLKQIEARKASDWIVAPRIPAPEDSRPFSHREHREHRDEIPVFASVQS